MGAGNALASFLLILLGLIVAQNALKGTLPQWLRAKFFNAGAPPRGVLTPVNPPAPGTPASAGTAYLLPVPGGRFVSGWGAPRDGGARLHQGIDLAATAGAPVVATADGVVTRVGSGGALCGLRVAVDHGNGLESIYCHLRNFAGIAVGQAVRRGQTIAYVGQTGNAEGPHLHFELRRYGEPVNPAPYYGL